MDIVSQARQFFEHHGRDIDKARFAYHFGDGTQDQLLEVLARYQNDDGGFGRGLEVDIKAPDSNPFATELALLICLQAGIPTDDPLLQRTVAYLEHTQDEDGSWRFTPGVYTHELAPWFQNWQWPNLNPSCTLAGLLKELGLGSHILHARVERLFDHLARVEDVAGDDFYGVRPYAFYFLPQWEHPQRDLYLSGVVWWLIRQHVQGVIDGDHFFAYVRHPDSATGTWLPEQLLSTRLDMLAAEQMEDGGWPSPYDPAWRPVIASNHPELTGTAGVWPPIEPGIGPPTISRGATHSIVARELHSSTRVVYNTRTTSTLEERMREKMNEERSDFQTSSRDISSETNAGGIRRETSSQDITSGQGEAAIPVVEEQMRIGKREVESGGVRVDVDVEQVPVEEQVSLREEHVQVERRPVNQAIDPSQVDQVLQEGSFEVRERAEQAVVDKQARVVEEVVINKQTEQRTETIQDTLRRTDVDVEQVPGQTRTSGYTETTGTSSSRSGMSGTSSSGMSSASGSASSTGGQDEGTIEGTLGNIGSATERATGLDLDQSGGTGDRDRRNNY